MREKRIRSLLKTISFRVLASLLTVATIWYFTGSIALSSSIGIIDIVSKLVLYYFHERLWNRVHWAKVPHPVQE